MARSRENSRPSVEINAEEKRRPSDLPKPTLNAPEIREPEVFRSRPKWETRLGRICFCFVITCWQFVGIVVIILQLILTLTSRFNSSRPWQRFHRSAVGSLLHLLLIPTICTFYYWNNIKLRLVMADERLQKIAFDPIVGLMVPNHSNDIDYLLCTILADQMRNIRSYKPLVKNELKYMPIFGWVLWLSDVPFVRREWGEDRLNLGKQLDRLLDCQQCILCLFAEGTRWTEAKQKASEEYAKQKGFAPFKYHLYPRKRGFNFAVRHYLLKLREDRANGSDLREFKIFNLQLLSPRRLTLNDYVNGRELEAEVYIEEVPISDEILEEVYNSKDEEECLKLSQLIVAMYRRKDEIVDEYKRCGFQLPLTGNRGLYPFESHRKAPLLTCILGLGLVHAFLFYIANTYGWSYFFGFFIGFGITCFFFLKRMEKETRSKSVVSKTDQSPPPTPIPEDLNLSASLAYQLNSHSSRKTG